MEFEELKKRIKLHEGFVPKIYKDTLGFATIGFGHKVVHEDNFVDGKEYTKEELESTFEKDFIKAIDGANRLVDLDKLHKKIQELVIECVFVLGPTGFSRFKRCLVAIEQQDIESITRELKDSRWAKNQAPNRVQHLCDTLEEIK